MPFLAQNTDALTCLAWSQNVKQDYCRQPLRLPCFEIWFPEKGLQCSEGGRIYKQLLWKIAKNHLTQLSTAHRSKGLALNSAGWGFNWPLHDFVRQEVGRSLGLEEVKGLLCFFVSCGRAWSISNDTAFCLPLYWVYPVGSWSSCWEKKNSRRKKLLNPHQNIWKIWWGGKEHKNLECSFLVRRLSEKDLAN